MLMLGEIESNHFCDQKTTDRNANPIPPKSHHQVGCGGSYTAVLPLNWKIIKKTSFG